MTRGQAGANVERDKYIHKTRKPSAQYRKLKIKLYIVNSRSDRGNRYICCVVKYRSSTGS